MRGTWRSQVTTLLKAQPAPDDDDDGAVAHNDDDDDDRRWCTTTTTTGQWCNCGSNSDGGSQ